MFDLAVMCSHPSNAITYSLESPRLGPAAHGLYLCQQRTTVQIIQLVEGPPPPRRVSPATSIFDGSSSTSSSSSSSSWLEEEEEYDEEEESICSSYCSSDAPPDRHEAPAHMAGPKLDRTYSGTMNRVFAWRETFSKEWAPPVSVDSSQTTLLKRKMDDNSTSEEAREGIDVDDVVLKRPRSQACADEATSLSASAVYSCPACDASFSSRQDLRLHGRAPGASEACCIAVEYSFE